MPIIGGLQKTSLLDFPEKIAAIVFLQGCNFRCEYCHNPELLKTKEPTIEESAFFDFLKTRQGKLDGVVITGGEPCIHSDLKDFIIKIRDLGFEVKLDSNGTYPEKIDEFLKEGLLDYIAMDIKAPLNKYKTVTGIDYDMDKIKKSIDLIMNSGIDYEFRTTVLPCFLSEEDIFEIFEMIKGARRYNLQQFVPSKLYNEDLMDAKTYSMQKLDEWNKIFKEQYQLNKA